MPLGYHGVSASGISTRLAVLVSVRAPRLGYQTRLGYQRVGRDAESYVPRWGYQKRWERITRLAV